MTSDSWLFIQKIFLEVFCMQNMICNLLFEMPIHLVLWTEINKTDYSLQTVCQRSISVVNGYSHFRKVEIMQKILSNNRLVESQISMQKDSWSTHGCTAQINNKIKWKMQLFIQYCLLLLLCWTILWPVLQMKSILLPMDG